MYQSQVEKVNNVILSCIATSSNELEGNDWDNKLYEVQWAINNSVHSVTKQTPFSLVHTYEHCCFAQNPLQDEIRKVNESIRISGDIVWVRAEVPATGQNRKLSPKYRGPYEIVKYIGNDRYLLQEIEGEKRSNRIYKSVISVDRLKLEKENVNEDWRNNYILYIYIYMRCCNSGKQFSVDR